MVNTKVVRDIPLAGIVQGQEEIDAVVRVLKSGWHVSGKECVALQEELADFFGVKYCVVVNSGSSANLLAMHCLNLKPGDKVLTSACGFPATLNPILHLGLTPVLVDYDLDTLNINLTKTYKTLEKIPNIKAMILAHTLGTSLDMDLIKDITDKFNVKLIEDCCEAVGSKWNHKYVGSFGDIGTISFYASHQMNGFGGGGALLTDNEQVYKQAKSLRDWGKGEVREGLQYTKLNSLVGDIPYDQQYTYQTVGYNMRLPDGNCAYVREQLKRLPDFTRRRQKNYMFLSNYLLDELPSPSPLVVPYLDDEADSSFFAFPILVREDDVRDKLVEYMESHGVHVRLFFAGNILKHLPYNNIRYESLKTDFWVADYLMKNALFCGCWPGLTLDDMEYAGRTIVEFFTKNEE